MNIFRDDVLFKTSFKTDLKQLRRRGGRGEEERTKRLVKREFFFSNIE